MGRNDKSAECYAKALLLFVETQYGSGRWSDQKDLINRFAESAYDYLTFAAAQSGKEDTTAYDEGPNVNQSIHAFVRDALASAARYVSQDGPDQDFYLAGDCYERCMVLSEASPRKSAEYAVFAGDAWRALGPEGAGHAADLYKEAAEKLEKEFGPEAPEIARLRNLAEENEKLYEATASAARERGRRV